MKISVLYYSEEVYIMDWVQNVGFKFKEAVTGRMGCGLKIIFRELKYG